MVQTSALPAYISTEDDRENVDISDDDDNDGTPRRHRKAPWGPTIQRQRDPDTLRKELMENITKDLRIKVNGPDLRDKYVAQVQTLLTGAGRNPTILHWVVEQLRESLWDLKYDAAMEIADMALGLKPSIIHDVGNSFGNKNTALHLAANHESLCSILDCVYERLESDLSGITRAISYPNENHETVVHIAIVHKDLHTVDCLCRLIDLAEPETFAQGRKSDASDGNIRQLKNTPLHDAVHVNISKPDCHENPMCEKCTNKRIQWLTNRRTVITIIEKLVEKDREGLFRKNGRNQTPYLYHQWSKLQQTDEAANAKAATVIEEESHSGAHGVTAILNNTSERMLPPSSKPVGKTKSTATPVVGTAPLLGHNTEAPEARTGESRCMEMRDEALSSLVESYLYHSAFTLSKFSQILTCFTEESVDQKVKKGKTLIFQIPRDPLAYDADDSFQFLDFGPTMTEVEVKVAGVSQDGGKTKDEPIVLPNLSLGALQRQWDDNTDSLIRFFDMLRRKEVRRIIKLTVWDNEDMPCNDETIARCLRGFDVRYLDWKKLDLSIDVVRIEAPNVVELWLKSMDSFAALRAWGGSDGICCLMQLSKLHVKLERGRENYQRYIGRVHTFLRDLRDNVAIFRASKILESRKEFLRDNIAIEETERICIERKKQEASENEREETSRARGSTRGVVGNVDPPQSLTLERRQTGNGRHNKVLAKATRKRERWEKKLAEEDAYIKTLQGHLKTYANKLFLLDRETTRLRHERQTSTSFAELSPVHHGRRRKLEIMKGEEIDAFEVEPIPPLTTSLLNGTPEISVTKTIHSLLCLDSRRPQSSNDSDESDIPNDKIQLYQFVTQVLQNLPVLVRVDQDFVSTTLLIAPTVDPPKENSARGEANTTADTDGDGSVTNNKSSPHIWMDTVKEFAQKYTHDKLKDETKGVTVALLDDGVSVDASYEFKGKISPIGWPEWSAAGPNENFFSSTNGHGTEMAKLIIAICPAVRIYVAKLPFQPDDRDSADLSKPKRKISVAKAAADAIRWAVTPPKVDIISMSWTVIKSTDDSSEHDKDIRDLKDAILEAALQGVIMYCSAADEGVYSTVGLWPKEAGTNALTSIGASHKDGHPLSKVDVGKINYLFPGAELEEITRGSREGSSAATAVAAGFAALIIWCFLKVEEDKGRVAKPANMTSIFENLKSSSIPFVDATILFKRDALGKNIMTPVNIVQECNKWILPQGALKGTNLEAETN